LSENPRISFVVASRNDNHGGDMLKRMRIFTKGLLYQCKKFKLRAEVVFVEWNPEPGKDLLHQILPGPKPDDYLTIRYVVVPNQIHHELKYSDRIPLFQMIAKNVGIRRAQAPFVVCTNVDLLFSDKLMKFLSGNNLENDNYYRANRCDIPREIDSSMPVNDMLAYSKKNIIQRLGKDANFPELQNTDIFLYHIPLVGRVLSLPAKLRKLMGKQTLDDMIASLDLSACGDFTCMSKEAWTRIGGYYELEAYSIHIDSIAIACATASGLNQVILGKGEVTYHISHDDGWEVYDLSNPITKMFKDLERPCVEWNTLIELCRKMIAQKEVIQINKSDWGFVNKDFKEYQLFPGEKLREIN